MDLQQRRARAYRQASVKGDPNAGESVAADPEKGAATPTRGSAAGVRAAAGVRGAGAAAGAAAGAGAGAGAGAAGVRLGAGKETGTRTAGSDQNRSSAASEHGIKKPVLKPSATDFDRPAARRRRIAQFLTIIGSDQAARVLKHLDAAEVEAIVGEVAALRGVSDVEARSVLAEFGGRLGSAAAPVAAPVGGRSVAQAMLVRAFGEDAGRQRLQRVLGAEPRRFFEFLEAWEPVQLQHVLKDESVAVVGLVLANVSPQLASGLLELLDPEQRTAVVLRLAKNGKVDTEVLARIEDAIKAKIRTVGSVSTQQVDGKNALAEIFRHLPGQTETDLLAQLDVEAPEIADDLRERLFTIDMIVLIDDRELKKVLDSVDDRSIAMIMKGRPQAVCNKLLENVSTRRAETIAEESRILGPQRRREVDAAVHDFVVRLRGMVARGELVVHDAAERYI